jgi:hypothetical protein
MVFFDVFAIFVLYVPRFRIIRFLNNPTMMRVFGLDFIQVSLDIDY